MNTAKTQMRRAEPDAGALQGRTWMWALPFLAVFLPIVLLSVYSVQLASGSVRNIVEMENLSQAVNLSQRITQNMTKNVTLAHALASASGTIAAVEERNTFTLGTRLKAIVVANAQVSRAYIVDPDGILWSEYPLTEIGYGRDMSGEPWFGDVMRESHPSITNIYVRPDRQFLGDPVAAIAVPILSDRKLIGALVFEYQVAHIAEDLKSIELGRGGHMYVADGNGALVAHPKLQTYDRLHRDYATSDPLVRARSGQLLTTRYVDPLLSQEMLATFMPVSIGSNTWVVVAQQPVAAAFALLDRMKLNLGIASGLLTLFTLVMTVALARMSARNIRLNRELQSANQSIKDFTSIVSHQLKAPITAMRWTLESMLDGDYGPLSEGMRSELQMLHGVNVSNYHLIMDILNVSRLDRGVVEIELKPVTLGEIAQRSIRDYAAAAEKAGLSLTVAGDAGGAIVMADLEKCAEAITNSISNALKYTEQGGITVTVGKGERSGIITVTDTGKGMDAAILESLFTRDLVAKKNASAESSSGLGLYIAKQFMQMQGGDVVCASDPGKGTTFTYTMRLATDAEKERGERGIA